MTINSVIVGVAILALTPAAATQRARGTVQLDAADCSRMTATFGDDQVAHAVQHVVVPLSVGTLDVRPGANGGVRIERGAGDGFSITACIAAGAATREEAQRAAEAVTLSVQGNRVRVADVSDARHWSVQLIIEAPRGAQIDVETANGPIGIHGVDGSFTARASNGPITVEDVSGAVRAVAVNGPISISGSRGNLDVETQNGPISVDLQGTRWDGELHARAQNGPLTVKVPDDYTSGLEISSSSRSPWSCRISACSAGIRDGDDRARTLRLGADPVTVRISTVNGPVTLDRARR
jgi:DUF4097 and DUF4098 domain-containing protein YvlB